jgi:hypothetical protein
MAPDPKPLELTRRRGGYDRRDRPWVEARAAWRAHAVRFGCIVCPALGQNCDGDLHAHHWLYAQHLRAYASAHAHEHFLTTAEELALECELVWHLDNGGGVCERAHRRHHNRSQPIPLALVPLKAITFAARLGLGYRLEEAYTA